MNPALRLYEDDGALTLCGAPEGFDARLLADIATTRGGLIIHVARDEPRATAMAEALQFFAPQIPRLLFPAWDCLPYDRVSPRAEVLATRMATLGLLSRREGTGRAPLIVLTTVNAALQRVPPRAFLQGAGFAAKAGSTVSTDALLQFLARNGFQRVGTVMEPGDYAVRGGLIDLFPPGFAEPVRLDFFGATLESVRSFNPEDQRTTGRLPALDLIAVNEVPLDEASVARFRAGYVAAFGAVTDEDPLYESVSEGRPHPGMEHFLPLFHEQLETLFDYAPDALIGFDGLSGDATSERLAQIADYYDARASAFADARAGRTGFAGATALKPLPPERLYLTDGAFERAIGDRPRRIFTGFSLPPAPNVIEMGAKRGRSFAPERQAEANVFEATRAHASAEQRRGRKIVIACWTAGSADRMAGVLADHGVAPIVMLEDVSALAAMAPEAVGIAVFGLETGFEADDLTLISEQDILGDRMVRARKPRRAANFIAEASALAPGDLVVHVDHGVGRYLGLKAIDVSGAAHDCLELQYDGGKLFLPVENIELLSRFGTDSENVALDRLGGSGWQSRKARLKQRIREMAEELIKVAAARLMKRAPELVPPTGAYDEFAASFPYEETEDQERAIEETLGDLAAGLPMDRLVCGDVGFGKTEVALRAAFATAMAGQQVAVVVPTTLLARQHFRTFSERMKGWPLKVRQLSRLVSAKDAAETRAGLLSGEVDIVVGTHALLAKSIAFKSLGLLIIDEEQHFGVAHKERLKQLKANVHVLTLTATPIPRTLQLALHGVKDMSLIATPPIDRLAVRTFVAPFDPLTIREALLREHYRGGQSFYVVPRIADLADQMEFLTRDVPEVKAVTAHGQMPPGQLDDVMNAFYERKYDVLLSTTIVESGLDIPTANTMIVWRADMFGLAQLYQLRGRIGRSKQRAYAYLTTPPNRILTAGAEQRLHVLQTLDTLGAGFTLASHDLDLRGSGNLLGDEQSGHIREVGIELYQDMLEEAVASLKSGDEEIADGEWSPQINLGSSVLIPEHYVADLNVRMSLYRRLGSLETRAEIDAFGAELIDRFGPLPDDAQHLLKIVEIKALCRAAGIAKIDAGPKGATIAFRNNFFANPEGLIAHIALQSGTMKVRPDQTLVVMRSWGGVEERLEGARKLVGKLAEIAAG
ncbi:MAG: transcription-repair coupling factor [Alphaproteobacteria bacterium]|nr:transcription-repair coupling factor [Alphaproteobacteria bacterium]